MKPCDTDFNLALHLIPFMMEVPFYGEIARHLKRQFTKDISTCAVSFDIKTDQLMLSINPDFFKTLSNSKIRGCLTHEFDHIAFGHLGSRFDNEISAKLQNMAQDLAIDSLLVTSNGVRRLNDGNEDEYPLPNFALVPGVRPCSFETGEPLYTPFADLIASLPPRKSSEWYLKKLEDEAKDSSGAGTLDDHSMWGGQPGDDGEGSGGDKQIQQEYVRAKVKSILEKAIRVADSTPTGWGNIPQEIREKIRKGVAGNVNWRSVLRQFVGTLVRGSRRSSIKRINRRYPYIHPGLKRGWQAKLLIAMDQSGSVYNEMLSEFFTELSSMTKRVSITLIPFDCDLHPNDAVEWRKGMTIEPFRKRSGGTDFDAPTKFFNDPKNKGRWDGMLIMTDGQAPEPIPAYKKRGWVLGQGCELNWKTNELQIKLSKENSNKNGWY